MIYFLEKTRYEENLLFKNPLLKKVEQKMEPNLLFKNPLFKNPLLKKVEQKKEGS
jgi:hypothetical protein